MTKQFLLTAIFAPIFVGIALIVVERFFPGEIAQTIGAYTEIYSEKKVLPQKQSVSGPFSCAGEEVQMVSCVALEYPDGVRICGTTITSNNGQQSCIAGGCRPRDGQNWQVDLICAR